MVLMEAGLLPLPAGHDAGLDWNKIDRYMYDEHHFTPYQLSRLTIAETLDMLPEPESTLAEAEKEYALLQRLTPEQWYRIALLVDR